MRLTGYARHALEVDWAGASPDGRPLIQRGLHQVMTEQAPGMHDHITSLLSGSSICTPGLWGPGAHMQRMPQGLVPGSGSLGAVLWSTASRLTA